MFLLAWAAVIVGCIDLIAEKAVPFVLGPSAATLILGRNLSEPSAFDSVAGCKAKARFEAFPLLVGI